LELLRFLDWVLVLPEDLTLAFDQFVHHYEEAKQMRYVTSFEQHGIQKGLEQGLLQQAQEAVVKVLQVRFTKLPKRLVKQIQQIKDRDQLSQLLEQAVLVNSLQEFESLFNPK
jgi:flagellar biosynthesis/type III secretory pathway protein FliH